MRWILVGVLTFSFAVVAHANCTGLPGHGHKKHVVPKYATKECRPVRTNTFSPLFDPPPVPGMNTEFGKFESWALTPEQAKLGFVARRASDNAYLVIPNDVQPKQLSWIKLVTGRARKQTVCASRIIATFESETDTAALAPLINAVRAADANARFVRPIMQNVQVEWTIPFLGLLHRFDPRPTFPLGGIAMVWDIDRKNTGVLERFIKNAGPSVDLPGVIMMREMYTGLLFSISLTMNGERLLANRVEVSADE